MRAVHEHVPPSACASAMKSKLGRRLEMSSSRVLGHRVLSRSGAALGTKPTQFTTCVMPHASRAARSRATASPDTCSPGATRSSGRQSAPSLLCASPRSSPRRHDQQSRGRGPGRRRRAAQAGEAKGGSTQAAARRTALPRPARCPHRRRARAAPAGIAAAVAQAVAVVLGTVAHLIVVLRRCCRVVPAGADDCEAAPGAAVARAARERPASRLRS